MKKFSLFLLLAFYLSVQLANASLLNKEVEDFLGAKPKDYAQKYLIPAKKLKVAQTHKEKGKLSFAMKEWSSLARDSEFMEHASYELALAYREKKNFLKSQEYLQKILFELPPSAYNDLAHPLWLDNLCDQALLSAKKAKNKNQIRTAQRSLQKCLAETRWKDWTNREDQVAALYDLLKKNKDPLFGSFVGEVVQAMPASTNIRVRIVKEIPNADLSKYADTPRFRINSSSPSGVKAVYPDVDLFNQGISFFLEEKIADANNSFKKILADYPESEHGERAQYWAARTDELLGNKESANQRYERIFQENFFSYYGLQSALRLGRDLKTYLVPGELKPATLSGTPITRHAQSLWKLRALLEVELADQAREEAEFLFRNRPGGFTFGQGTPEGALYIASLYQSAGYHLAAFSHAYAATTLDPNQTQLYTFDLIFPQAFFKDFLKASENTNIHPLLLLSLSKQESAFLPTATSRANALGLMQLLLSTAKEVSPKVTREDLFTPSVNTQVGSKYLQKLLERFESIPLALAAYNAGPSRAAQWQKKLLEYSSMRDKFDVDAFIDFIPFTETRKYVGNILRNYAWYKLLNKDGTIKSVQELATQWQKDQPENPPQKNQDSDLPNEPSQQTVEPYTPKETDTSDLIEEL